jgi:hypothetical protein
VELGVLAHSFIPSYSGGGVKRSKSFKSCEVEEKGSDSSRLFGLDK